MQPLGLRSLEALSAGIEARFERGRVRVPVLPQIATELLGIIGSPDVSASRLSSLVHRDQALAGNVLRIANSPAYMPRTPIVSLPQAIARIGIQQLSNLAFAISLKAGTYRVPGYERVLDALWNQAVSTGAWTKEIARMQRKNVDAAFLCGLLSRVGHPLVLEVAAEVSEGPLSPEELAQLFARFGGPVGGIIADRWKLPPMARAVITTPIASPAHPHRVAIEQVRAASDLMADPELTTSPAFQALNFYPDDVARLVTRAPDVAQFIDGMRA